MVVLLHIFIALASIIAASIAYLSPSKAKLNFSYGLIALTFITGTYLVIMKPAHMVQTCFTGLVYLGVVSVAIIAAHRKLVKSQTL